MASLVVYLDLVFLTNLLLDAALLRMTAWSRRLEFRWWRLMLAAGVGASYVIMLFFPAFSFLFTTLIKLVFSIIMLVTAFGFVHVHHLLRNLGAFYLISFCVAGFMFGLHYILQSTGEVFNGIWFSRTGEMSFHMQTGIMYVALSFLGALWFYRSVQRSRRRQVAEQQFVAEVEVGIDDASIEFNGLIDTGNRLYDPLTRTPVMVCELTLWQAHIPPELYARLQSGRAEEVVAQLDDCPFKWRDRLRLVPYKGIHRGTEFMLALKPDRVTVRFNGQHHNSSKVMIGLKGDRLHNGRSYRAIVHPELVNL